MSSIDEVVDSELGGGPEKESIGYEAAAPVSGGIDLSAAFQFIKTQTGPGSVEEYINSPFNWNGSRAVARILRGLTGFLGGLDFALADILIGFWEFKSPPEGRVDNVG